MSAAQHNRLLEQFYKRLRAGGKPVKLARVAAARKLLENAWAVATKEQELAASYRDRKERCGEVG